MKLKTLYPIKTKYNTNHISVYALKTIDFPLYKVLQECLVDFDSKPVFKIDTLQEKYFSFYSHEEIKLYEFTLRGIGKVKGAIVYNDPEELAEFLIKNYIPAGNYFLDTVMKQISCLPKKRQKKILTERIIVEYLSILSDPSPFRGSILKYKIENEDNLLGVVVHEYSMAKVFSHRPDFVTGITEDKKIFLYKKVSRSKIIIKITCNCGKQSCRKFIIRPTNTAMFFYYDGHSTHAILLEKETNFTEQHLISYLSKEVYTEFDTYGSSTEVDREYLIPTEFQPLYLLRVPSYEEAKSLIDKIYDKQSSNLANFHPLPLLVYDTRSNLKLPKKIKIIKSVKMSLAILSRIKDWLYSPKNYPATHNIYPFLEEQPYYLALGVIE